MQMRSAGESGCWRASQLLDTRFRRGGHVARSSVYSVSRKLLDSLLFRQQIGWSPYGTLPAPSAKCRRLRRLKMERR